MLTIYMQIHAFYRAYGLKQKTSTDLSHLASNILLSYFMFTPTYCPSLEATASFPLQVMSLLHVVQKTCQSILYYNSLKS